MVAPTALEAQRVSGDKNIVPDDATKMEIERSGRSRVVVPVKICLDDRGRVKSTTILKSSGFDAYDARLTSEIEDTWRYRPFLVNGIATPVCSAVTFIYVQR